jgi:predicted enzyme related to lactoylglutathione lyase
MTVRIGAPQYTEIAPKSAGGASMLKQFTTLMVYVRDMDRAVSFYRDVLGLDVEVQSPGWSQFKLGNGASLGLHVAMGEIDPKPGWVPGFSVEDVRAAKEKLVASGAMIAQDYHDIPGGVVLEFTDPDGNHIDVSQMGISCADLGVASR